MRMDEVVERYFNGGPLDGKRIKMPSFYKSWRIVIPNRQLFFERPIDPLETFDYELVRVSDGLSFWLEFWLKGKIEAVS